MPAPRNSPWNDSNKFILTLDDHITVNSEPRCPRCGSDDLRSQGPSPLKTGANSRYLCRPCKKYFTCRDFPYEHKRDEIIEYALSLMPTMTDITQAVIRRFNEHVDVSTIYSWYRKYRWPNSKDGDNRSPRLVIVQEVKVC